MPRPLLRFLTFTTVLIALPLSAVAVPAGGTVSAGSAAISSTGNQTVIDQSSAKAVIDWNSFNIGQGESVRFNQPNASAIALNRIHDANPSTIQGQISANGNVWLVNPNGVLFGNHARVDVNGLLATTSIISNNAFMAGDLRFIPGGNPDALVSNAGDITVAQGGLAALVAPAVRNSGSITARLGKVALASGDSFTLDMYGDGLVSLAASPALRHQLVQNSGTITADGGMVRLTTAQAQGVVDSAINMDGVIQANAVDAHNGVVDLISSGNNTVTGTIQATGGAVETSGKILGVTGRVNAATWLLDPNDITIQSAGPDTNVTGSPNFTSTNDGSIVTTGSIEAALNSGTSVTIATAFGGTNLEGGDIYINGLINKTAGGDATLRLNAYRDIKLINGYSIVSSSGKLNILLDANAANAGTGSIFLQNFGSQLISNGGNIILGGGADPLNQATSGTRYGIYAYGSEINAGGGNISLRGGVANPTLDNVGIKLIESLVQTSGTGNILLSGTGAGGPSLSHGIDIRDGTQITAEQGNIQLTGTGGANSDSFSTGVRTFRTNGSNRQNRIATTSGNIDINGTGGNGAPHQGYFGTDLEDFDIQTTSGDIHIVGNGGSSGTGGNIGIYLASYHSAGSSTLQTDSGNILLTGNGGLGGNQQIGIYVDAGVALTATGTGNITLNGTAGNGTSAIDENTGNQGIFSSGEGYADAVYSVHDGALTLNGVAAGSGNYNYGVLLAGGNVFKTTGSGSIQISGQGNNGAAGIQADNYWDSRLNQVGDSSTAGRIDLVADSVSLTNFSSHTGGILAIRPYTAGTDISIGIGIAGLQVDDAMLSTIDAGSLIIGSVASGAVDINSAHHFAYPTTFISGSGKDLALSGSLFSGVSSGNAFTLVAGRNFINMAGSNAVNAGPGHYLVYTSNASMATLGGLAFDFAVNCLYGVACSGIMTNPKRVAFCFRKRARHRKWRLWK